MVALPGFFERLVLAWRVLTNASLAARVHDPGAHSVPSLPAVPPPIAERVEERIVERVRIDPAVGALQLLSILQRDGRLVDFLQEDLAGASDADIGAAARIVHQGASRALKQYFTLAPVRTEAEGAAVVVEKGFDANSVRLSGNVAGDPPYRGTLAHAGWRATSVQLPERSAALDAKIVAPAEIEL